MIGFKCKMCGGELEYIEGTSVAECQYCGTKQTLPKLADEHRANLYDRANHFRRTNDYDKAMDIYEKLVTEEPTDAEAYWSIVLCRYGIEYVEDPATKKRVPTINRTQFASILADEDFKSALKYADALSKAVYEEEAQYIDRVQRGILSISRREEPFDVFICYKETDENGRRTRDSVLANEIYHQLKQEGMKVFFAKITLEDKIGEAYEPYIFAALNSAKVMVVLGTRPAYFTAVWVKNEWSRYLSLIRAGQRKTLIPAYRDMDPYDLPEEFSHLQALDMGNIGFMTDLIRGIKKLVSSEKMQEASPSAPLADTALSGSAMVAPMLDRAFLFLEDGDWESADQYLEKVLDQDPRNARAYVGKLMTDLKVETQERLADCKQPFDGNRNYQKAIRFADPELEMKLKGYLSAIGKRIETARMTGIYNDIVAAMNAAKSEEEYRQIAERFAALSGFADADQKKAECLTIAEEIRIDPVYKSALSAMEMDTVESQEKAIRIFESIADWKDSRKKIEMCRRRIEKIRANEAESIYRSGMTAMKRDTIESQEKAIRIFESIADWKDSREQIEMCRQRIEAIKENVDRQHWDEIYDSGVRETKTPTIEAQENAIRAFGQVKDWKDAKAKIEECRENIKDIKIN